MGGSLFGLYQVGRVYIPAATYSSIHRVWQQVVAAYTPGPADRHLRTGRRRSTLRGTRIIRFPELLAPEREASGRFET
jgi:hypothetical protein